MIRGSRSVAVWILAVLVVAAALAPWLSPFAPDALDLVNRRAMPSVVHWFGTDDLGRDLLSRVLSGARVSLAVGLLSAGVAGLIGVGIGAASGVAGGAVDTILMRLTDAALSVPRLLMLMVASAVLSPSIPLLVLLVGLVGWMETARVTRAAFLTGREREFVLAARALRRLDAADRRRAPASCRGAGDCRGRDPRRRPRHPARIGAEFFRDRGPAASRQLGQYALPGPVGDEHRAVARALSGPVHLFDRRGRQ